MSSVREADAPAPPAAPTEVAAWRLHLASFLLGRRAVVVPLVLAVVLFFYPSLSGGNEYWINQLSQIAMLALVVSGVNLSFGYAGEVQFGQVFMFALGAYLGGALSVHGTTADLLPLLLIGGAAATLAGIVIALPALRIGGWSLAMASFFLVICTPDLVAIFTKWTGGRNGLVGIPSPTLFGQTLTSGGLYQVIIVVSVLWFAAYRNLVTSRYGTLFRILRESPVQAQSLAFSPGRLKLTAYAFGALPAGMAGVLFGFVGEFLQPESFGLTLAIGVVAASVLGGVESVYGAIIGAAILQLGPQGSLSFQEYAPIAYGAFLIVAAVAFRRGLGGIGKDVLLKLSNRLAGGAAGARVVTAGSLSAHLHEDTAEEAQEVRAQRHSLLGERDGTLLEVNNINKTYGGVTALDDVTLSAKPGEVTSLIGSNGSGKTTLLNVICGYAKADGGTVTFDGEAVAGLAPHRLAALGVGRTFQTPSMPRGVSVLDVVASGRFHAERCGPLASILRLPRYYRARRADREEALVPLDLVGLAHLADEEAGELSLGTRRLVEVARALCGRPRLLLLDEPASGLSEEEVDRLGEVIRIAAASGTTVVLIEHNFGFVTRVSDVAHVLHVGTLIASGHASTIAEDPEVIESYLGASARTGAQRIDTSTAEPVRPA